MELPWHEKCVSFQVNPESATVADIVRMAEELIEAKRLLAECVDGDEINTQAAVFLYSKGKKCSS